MRNQATINDHFDWHVGDLWSFMGRKTRKHPASSASLVKGSDAPFTIKDLRPYIPHNFERYLEVNVETADIMRALAPQKAILQFSSAEIFDVFTKVRNNVEGLRASMTTAPNSYQHYLNLDCNLEQFRESIKPAHFYNIGSTEFLNTNARRGDFVLIDLNKALKQCQLEFSNLDAKSCLVEWVYLYDGLVSKGSYPLLVGDSFEGITDYFSHHEVNLLDDGKFVITPKWQEDNTFKYPATLYRGNQGRIIGSLKQFLDDLGAEKVFDAFSGSGVVSYLFKNLGYEVIGCDNMHYAHHLSKALVENSHHTLNQQDIAFIFQNNENPGFITETFKGLYFSEAENRFLDRVCFNIHRMKHPYKKSLALAALGRACLRRRPRSIFTYVGFHHDTNFENLKTTLKDHFLIAIQDLNRAVFNNGKSHQTICGDVMTIQSVDADLVYLDPPYPTTKGDNDNSRRYHFIEGLCTNWSHVKIQHETKTKKFERYKSLFNTIEGSRKAFEILFDRFNDKTILLYWNSMSAISRDELVEKLISKNKRVNVFELSSKSSIQNHEMFGREYLILAK